ncbi:hypothetical protein BX616_000019 [Lobosporangium transversale]|uniref:Uncharacterized protein n=1 Tax=Lobosporangium transversale TaxID=64571 RepID=A0A1Y2G8X8_9FUNG|nr:hypothetical protein BCR41DRAFT_328176 [Lobosporangium transversale]KAF9919408.1 hypothetical protein BX616_000019 [Lobosporangium transversale]ORZ04546.1 hypothetical protein BCR41DRAFT_328176 [Lobosporangium transversale]|eukprot:XP_021876592.1 hypothetical protein BCR41DRAFT_328176 [Lobosporangium transversale]
MSSFGSPITRDGTGTIRRREITLSPREKQLYGQLWIAADKDQSGFITGADAVPFFAKSGLPPQVLGQIWVIADADNKGVLGQQGFSIAVKLIAHAQNGKTPSAALINIDAPLPHFEGLTPAKTGDSSSAAAPIATQTTGSEPSLTNEDRMKYGGMFVACGPVNGLLDGEKAREVFLKSKLPVEKLSQIWALADTKQRGSLDITDFTIAMYYIQHTMDGSIKNLPSTLPASILRVCTSTPPGTGAGVLSSPVMSAQTLTRQSTGNNMNIHNPTITRQLTGSVGMTSSPLSKQNTGGNSALFGGSSSSAVDIPWEVTPEEKAKFDGFFDRLDPNGTGFVGGEEASKFFLNSRLPESVLAQIWDLSDITGSGRLSKDEFAVAMLLINRKNTTGAPIPKTLPLSLVPPSLRHRVAPSLPFASQDPLRNMTLPVGQSSQHFRRQSFDLLGDGPALGTSISHTGVSQPDKDLIGAEDLTSKITSETGELASMQNQINSLSKVTGDLQAKRSALEKNLSALSAQKQDISIRLNQIKTLHESETKSIKEIESALATIQPQLKKLREELSVSERELAVARSNKDEYFLSLAKDQEESNQIRARLRQNNEETIKLREELEAKRKDTGRQKGLLEIARRQLATSDADKQKLINEIAEESEKAAQAAKQIHALSTTSFMPSSSPTPSSSPVPPPPPAPRGSRKEPPPPPASRGSAFASRASPEEEEAFGIPEALRSPTGSFHSVHSPRTGTNAPLPPASVSRQSTGTSPFEAIPRQSSGTSPFESISKQGTGTSPFEPISRQGTGMSGEAPSVTNVGEAGSFFPTSAGGGMKAQDDLWSPMTHAAQAKTAGQPEVSMSPDPETSVPPQNSLLAFAAAQTLPVSPPVSQDPFGAMAFPAIDTPPVTKMDFDSAFQGFSTGASSKGFSADSVKSAEAFSEAFPDIDVINSSDSSKAKRVSAFGFDDDFASSPFSQTLEKSKEDEEFPPIVEIAHDDDDSSDDDSDSGDNDTFVQAKSSVTSPEPFPVAPFLAVENASITASETQAQQSGAESSVATTVPAVAPISTGPKKLTAADFSEFESSFDGGEGDDFDSAFKGVEFTTPKKSSGAVGKISGFDDSFDFNASFEDPFGSSSAFRDANNTNAQGQAASKTTSSGAFGPVDLDEAFGGFGVSSSSAGASSQPATAGAGKPEDTFSHGFDDFEAEFASSSSFPASSAAPATVALPPRPVSATPDLPPSTAAPNTLDSSATSLPAPPAVPLVGVDELINMGFTRQQAEDALLRYDTVERAANFLLGGQ